MRSRLNSVAWITSLIAAGIAMVITTVIPAGYFVNSYEYMIGSMDTHAELAARAIEGRVMANPNTWQFEEIRLEELLQRHHDQEIPESLSIVDSCGNVIARVTDQVSNPLLTRRCDIYDAGAIVGHIELSRSLRSLLTRTALVCAASALVGGCIFLILRIIPLRAVRAEQLKSQKLETQNRQLQKAESLGRMAGAIAHHFNNLLGVVIGNLEMAMIDLTSGSDVKASLAEALKASHRAAEVGGLMLTYLGQTPGKQEPLDLSETCRRSLPTCLAMIPKDAVLGHHLPSPGPTIRANASQIQQILTILITNAWEAVSQSRISIHLSVKIVSSADIPATHRHPIDWQPQHSAYACLELADTGCGIAEQDIEKVFDPFFSSKFIGRGLGLPVAQGIARAHGGVLTVESELGRGSVLRVFFPLSAEEVLRQPDKAASTSKFEGGGTVLLIEDEEQVRNMAGIMLARLGYRVLEARDGVEAVEMFQQHRNEIRCVLSDLTMPRMNGWETLAALRKLSPDIPVILSSGYDEARVMEGKHAELPQVFLHKPYRMAELKAAFGAAMAASSAESMKRD